MLAGHYLAAAAAFSILENGGNAIDAGCCAGMALAVLHPDEVNFAGVAPIMIRIGAGKVVTIAGLGHWPETLPKDLFMREHNGAMPLGVLRTVVPAAPDAWITALKDFGTMSFGDVAAAADRFAREGFAVFKFLANEFAKHEEDYRRWPTSAKLFLPEGRAPKLNERFMQTDLAGTIQYMADEERAAAGKGRIAALEAARVAFYCGDIAVRIAQHQKEEGGYLSFEDLANFHSRYEDPVITRWRDFQVITCGPWCQGPMLAQALLMVERAGLDGLKHNEPAYIHLLIEILKSTSADREYHYGDPRFVDVGLATLLSDEHIANASAASIAAARCRTCRRTSITTAPRSRRQRDRRSAIRIRPTCVWWIGGGMHSPPRRLMRRGAPPLSQGSALCRRDAAPNRGRIQPSVRCCARQTPAAHAEPGHSAARRRIGHAVWRAGR